MIPYSDIFGVDLKIELFLDLIEKNKEKKKKNFDKLLVSNPKQLQQMQQTLKPRYSTHFKT